MYRLAQGATQNLADVEAFIEMLNTWERNPSPALSNFFDADKELLVTRAPGRLDVMGGIADYSGSLVLELPIAEGTLVALQRTDDRLVRIVSLTPGADSPALNFEMSLFNSFSILLISAISRFCKARISSVGRTMLK